MSSSSTLSPASPEPITTRPSRGPGAAQVAGLVSFPLMGAALLYAGFPMGDVFALLGGCGAIGAATFTAAGGGKRIAAVLAEIVLRATTGK
ncbi:hypothetical protein [Streptomyces sp. NPDC048639]|uniref:hypothetical protein n=1 Tax=Streptomyces sp. NPDC048639 TaxID=3365581 RepID=UPI00371C4110